MKKILMIVCFLFIFVGIIACEEWTKEEICNYCCQWENPKKAYEAHMDVYKYSLSKKSFDSSYISIEIFMLAQAYNIKQYCMDETKYKREKCDCSPD